MPPRPMSLSASIRSTNLLRTRLPLRSISVAASKQQPQLNLKLKTSFPQAYLPQNSIRAFSSTRATSFPATSSGKSQADLIVEELQELYETAADELDIATESTDSATIYAASDRESARDALNSLVIAYELYTSSEPGGAAAGAQQAEGQGESQSPPEGSEGGGGGLVELSIDPADVEESVREEVKKRVGQRVREVRNAVELLERRAHD
ncbi:hypothetical protein BDV18DRAFT_157402 [Aspergillus unguis]